MSADDLYERANEMLVRVNLLAQHAGQLILDAQDMWTRIKSLPPGLYDIPISPLVYTDCANVPAPLPYIDASFQGGGIVLIQTGAFWHRVTKSENGGTIMEAEALNNGKVFKILNPKVKITRVAFAQKSGA